MILAEFDRQAIAQIGHTYYHMSVGRLSKLGEHNSPIIVIIHIMSIVNTPIQKQHTMKEIQWPCRRLQRGERQSGVVRQRQKRIGQSMM